jgi:hypothetical protein
LRLIPALRNSRSRPAIDEANRCRAIIRGVKVIKKKNEEQGAVGRMIGSVSVVSARV